MQSSDSDKSIHMPIRIIPKLEIKGPNVVKGVRFDGLRVVGSPASIASYYYKYGADELIYIDTVASLYGRNNLLDIVQKTAENLFIPLTVGGGLKSIDDIKKALNSGADKVAINTAAIQNPTFIREASNYFGSSTIVIQIDVKKRDNGFHEAYTENGRESSGKDVFEWAREAIDLGAGELLLTSVDRDGTGKGFDLELLEKLSQNSPIPVIAASGAKNYSNVLDCANVPGIDAISISSLLHMDFLEALERNDIEDNTVAGLSRFIVKSSFYQINLAQLKSQLLSDGISIASH